MTGRVITYYLIYWINKRRERGVEEEGEEEEIKRKRRGNKGGRGRGG